MTNTVIHMNPSIDGEVIDRLFKKFTSHYKGAWTSGLKNDQDWMDCHKEWLSALSIFTLDDLRKAAKEALTICIDFPPTLPRLVKLCLKASGIPSEDDILLQLKNREFTHPLAKMIYSKIGSWDLKNGKSEEIKRKTTEYYSECLCKFRENPKQQWEFLRLANEQKLLELPEPDKIPNAEERKNFKGLKEMLVEHRQAADKAKKETGFTFPEFDEKEIQEGSPGYDGYCRYLLSIPDHMVLNIPPKHAYRRQRLLNRAKTAEHLRESGYVRPEYREPFVDPRKTNGKPNVIYKDWRDN